MALPRNPQLRPFQMLRFIAFDAHPHRQDTPEGSIYAPKPLFEPEGAPAIAEKL